MIRILSTCVLCMSTFYLGVTALRGSFFPLKDLVSGAEKTVQSVVPFTQKEEEPKNINKKIYTRLNTAFDDLGGKITGMVEECKKTLSSMLTSKAILTRGVRETDDALTDLRGSSNVPQKIHALLLGGLQAQSSALHRVSNILDESITVLQTTINSGGPDLQAALFNVQNSLSRYQPNSETSSTEQAPRDEKGRS